MNTHNKRTISKVFSIVLSILISCPYVFAGEVGKVTYTEGRVDLFKQNSDVAVPLREGETISVGDSIRTKSNSKTEVTFDDKSVVRLAQNSKVEVKSYELDEKKARKSAHIALDRGKVRTIIAKMHSPADFVISTPNSEGTVKGSDVFAFFQAGNSGMLVSEGKLSVVNLAHPDDKLIVPAGNSVLVPMEELPKGPRPYFELEKKFHEDDTNIPISISRRDDVSVTKGVITKISGEVKITAKDSKTPHDTTLNEIIEEGYYIETGANGMIEIKFDNGNAVNLKPNTKLTILKLAIDPKTLEYENLLEVTEGKVRARIENLKGSSSFKVRTPTAISGARATLMYLVVSPATTQVLFEGGNGFISNLISGLEETVAAGENSRADDQGFVAAPASTSEGERMNWTEGWDPGSGVEGYSAPEGTVGVYLASDDTGAVRVVGRAEAPAITGPGPLVLIPRDPDNPNPPTPLEPEEPSPVENVTSGGGLSSGTYYYGQGNGILEGIVNLIDSFWNDGDVAEFISAGNFSSDGREPFVWHSGRDSLYSGDITNNYMTLDGGAFYGIGAGFGFSGILDGFARLIYIDPQGNAGIAGGDLVGIYGLGAYVLGSPSVASMRNFGNIEIAPEDLYRFIWKEDNDEISGDEYLLTMSLVNQDTGEAQDWGIYKFQTSEVFEGLVQNSLPETVGGDDVFGAYYNNDDEELDGDDGYWFADVTYDSVSGGLLFGNLNGKFITGTRMGDITGPILGTYSTSDEENNWQLIGVGEWIGQPLTFSGVWGEEETSIYNNADDGYLSLAGEEYGLIGSTVADWWEMESFSILAIGQYNIYEGDEPFIWNTAIQSNNVIEGDSTTLDGGAFWGFTIGSWDSGILDGAVAAFYVDPNGNAGLLRGRVSGGYYSDISMWMVDGYLAATQLYSKRNLDATNLHIGDGKDGYIIEDEIYETRGLYGNFFTPEGEAVGEIWGYQDEGYSYSFPDDKWGIFNIKLGDGSNYDNPDRANNTRWSAEMGGYIPEDSYWLIHLSGTWANDKVKGVMNGRYLTEEGLGIIEGDLFGVNDEESGTWIGTTLGTWVEEELAFGGGFSGGFGYYDYEDRTVYLDDGDIYGLFGGVESLWTSAPEVTIIGEFDNSDGDELWGVDFEGETNDNAKIFGAFGGTNLNNVLKGILYALYIRPDPNDNTKFLAGYIRSINLAGGFYPELELFEAIGNLSHYLDLPTTISPSELYEGSEALDEGYFGGKAIGDISGFIAGESIRIIDQNWGLWRTGSGGTYQTSPGNNWHAVFGGVDEYEDEGEDWVGYWIGNVTGDKWQDGELSATIAGRFLNYETLGTFRGEMRGTFENGNWQALSIGEYAEEPLTLGGIWDDALYYNNRGNPIWAGRGYGMVGSGLVGSAMPDWWNKDLFPFLAMGTYSYQENVSESEPKIWVTPIKSYDSDGAFYGYTTGLWKNGVMDGSVTAIYLDPDGNAGVLKGDVSGNYYPDLSMWVAEGMFEPMRLALDTGIGQDDLGDYVRSKDLSADIIGSFGLNGAGYIEGRDFLAKTHFIVDDSERSKGWGIYDMTLRGSQSYNNPDNSKIWTAVIEGRGRFGYEGSNGVMKGKLFGTYDEAEGPNQGYWIASSVGTWQSYDEGGARNKNGEYYGFIGGIWEDGDIIGGMAAIYVQPFDFEGDWESALNIGELSGSGLGSFAGGGTITTQNFSGSVASIYDSPWGIWKSVADGGYTTPTSPWRLALGGTTSYESEVASYWLGTVDGERWSDGRLKGEFNGILLSETEDGFIAGGIISGGMVGDYVEVDETGGTWQAVGVGEWVEVTELLQPDMLRFDMETLNDFVSVPITEVYSNTLTGANSFINTAVMDISLFQNEFGRLWTAPISGGYDGSAVDHHNWSLTLTQGNDVINLINGHWAEGNWTADVTGTVGGNSITGQSGGSYADGNFQGVGAGTWTPPAPPAPEGPAT